MLPKLVRYLGSSIEEGAMASFSNVLLGRDTVSENNFTDALYLVWRLLIKRGIDIIGSSIIFLLGLPLFFLIALAIKLSSPGPIFFRQERMGHHGKVFRIWKFRTMFHENTLEDHRRYIRYLLQEGSQAESRVDLLTKYISHVEAKTTKIGSLLRTSSLDELPQLLNILRSDMSLVGPRPHPVYEVNEYKEWYKRRLNVKPGLTGWSKINLRCTPKNYEESILYDLWYIDHWSLTLDLHILIKTILYVIFRKDAH